MKKISTKIIILSLINSLIVAATNVVASIFMNSSRSNIDASITAVDAAGVAGIQNGAQFLLPTPIWIGLIISLTLGVVLSYIFGRLISKPILMLTDIARKTSDFDLLDDEQSFEDILKYKDETGAMAEALLAIRKALREMATKLQYVSSSLTSHSDNLTKTTDESVKAITQVASTVDQIAEGNNSQAQTINEVNETLLEVVKLIDKVTDEASTGAENAVESLEFIAEGQSTVDIQAKKMDENISVSAEANRSINELSKLINQVANITSIITSIAGQTNLLALNASIEAARAGEAGRGFAVVADEIRKLAEESSRAANNITDIIENTTDKTSLAVLNINKASELINEQKEALKITQEAFRKIKTSYNGIVNGFKHTAAGMQTINEKSKEISNQTQDMAAIAEEFAASTQEISTAGQEQLISTEFIAQASKDLYILANELSTEINKIKIQ
ncbi:MAG TPA: methyl-accepting chemotaxis protein [Patescibacteria group bacterium]|nr:methyl-accepting chemotaxis protein [Patescibacteria group bacterium]